MIKKYKPLFYLLLLASILSFFNYRGIDFSDEYVYSLNAWKIANGTFELSVEPFDNRFGLIYPMALLTKLLGAKAHLLPIWTFITFIFLIITNYYFVNLVDNKVAILSTLFIVFNPILLELSAEVAQDLVVTSFSFISVMIVWYTRIVPGEKSLTLASLFSLFIFVAFTTKMSVFLIAPFFSFFFTKDLINNQNNKFWLYSILFSLLLLIIYFLGYFYFTGDPFYRFDGMGRNHYTYPESYGNRPDWELLARITVFPIPFLLMSYGIGVFFSLALLWFFRFDWRKINNLPNFIFLYFLYLLFIHWFGSMSLKNYNPITFSERMWLLLVPPLVILSAFSIDKVLPNLVGKQKKWTTLYLGLISGLCALGLFLGGDRYPWFILPLFVCILLLIWMRFGNRNKSILLTIVLFPFLLVQLNNIYHYKENTPFFFQRDFLEALSTSEKHLIYTDRNLVDMYDIYYEFSPPDNIIYRKWETADSSDLADFDRFYVVYDQKKKEWLEDFLKLEVPSFVKDETVGRHILDNKYLKIKELRLEGMRKIKRFENE